MVNMKGSIVLAAMVVLVAASTAHAGKRLTTSSSGLSDSVDCTIVNVSDTKTITVDIKVRNQTAGGVISSFLGVILPPFGGRLDDGIGPDLWCEFVVVEGGAAKDLRASMVVYEGGVVTTIEPAREK